MQSNTAGHTVHKDKAATSAFIHVPAMVNNNTTDACELTVNRAISRASTRPRSSLGTANCSMRVE